jgi:hypothetical protein
MPSLAETNGFLRKIFQDIFQRSTEISQLRQIRRLFTHLGASWVCASFTDTSTEMVLHNSRSIFS